MRRQPKGRGAEPTDDSRWFVGAEEDGGLIPSPGASKRRAEGRRVSRKIAMPEYLCFLCPVCQNDGSTRYRLKLEPYRDDYKITCACCRTVSLYTFDGEYWMAHILQKA